MTRIALVVSDVDGTLLTKDKTLTEAAKAAGMGAIKDMQNKVPIYVGPLKDNKTGKVVIDKTYGNLDPFLDKMDYLLEGVVGSIT